jgi:hypothetical protein
MKQFKRAVESVEESEQYEAKVTALLEKDPSLSRKDAENQITFGAPTVFEFYERVIKSYQPLPAQLAFLMASMGRGQTNDARFAAIVNIMLESLKGDDKDWFESLLITGDPKKSVDLPVLEEVFAYLTEEWFRDDAPEGDAAV